jgi:hypothetical protein
VAPVLQVHEDDMQLLAGVALGFAPADAPAGQATSVPADSFTRWHG